MFFHAGKTQLVSIDGANTSDTIEVKRNRSFYEEKSTFKIMVSPLFIISSMKFLYSVVVLYFYELPSDRTWNTVIMFEVEFLFATLICLIKSSRAVVPTLGSSR